MTNDSWWIMAGIGSWILCFLNILMGCDVKLGFLEKMDIFGTFHNKERWVWLENIYEPLQGKSLWSCGLL